jgi:hypothetical protein
MPYCPITNKKIGPSQDSHWRHRTWFHFDEEDKELAKAWPDFKHIDGTKCRVSRCERVDPTKIYHHEVVSYTNEYIEPLPFSNIIILGEEKSEEPLELKKVVTFGEVYNIHRSLIYINWIRTGAYDRNRTEKPGIFEDDDTSYNSQTRDCTDSRSTYSDYSEETTGFDISSSKSKISLLSQYSWTRLLYPDYTRKANKEDIDLKQVETQEYSEEDENRSDSETFFLPDYYITIDNKEKGIKREYFEDEDIEDSKPLAKKCKF